MSIQEEVLAAARRICRERGVETFRVSDIVQSLPHLNPSSVRTHVVSRCCVNAPKNHPHKWPYFRRCGRGEYEIVAKPDAPREISKRVAESAAPYASAHPLRDTIHAVVRRSAGCFYAEGLELAVVTQARSLDELVRNLRQAIRLHLEGEDASALGLVRSPRIAITYEEEWSGDAEA
jgi:hypothetical protein